MRVLSVDPGGTSYLSRGGAPPGKDGATGAVLFAPVGQLSISVLNWREVVDRVEFLNWVAQLKVLGQVDYCICEYYHPAAFTKTWQPDIIWIIGTLDFLFGPDKFFYKTNARTAEAWGTDTKIRPYIQGENAVGRGGKGHALMALKHSLHWTAHHWDQKS